MWFLKNPGILGINARNLLYIKPYNPKKAVVFADSKLKTKNFLSVRNIPVAKLYAAIRTPQEVETFDWGSLPASFVIKPNAGFGGEGILIIKGRKGRNWISGNDKAMHQKELENHIRDILEGRYSLADLADIVLFEQLLEAAPPLSEMSYKGLPDIRVVVHNLIPVMAMLRLSTEESQGTANVHRGGIGVGIDISKGETTYATQYNKIIEEIPHFGKASGVKIPHWEEILLITSRIQQITNLGFAAVDIAIDKHMGPVLLEINARAGLMVQVANLAPLRRRLEQIKGIKVPNPEKGVRIARDIFGHKVEQKKKEIAEKTVVGNIELVELMGKNQNKTVEAQIEPNIEKTVLDQKVAARIGVDKDLKLKFSLLGHRIQTVVELRDLSAETYKLRIGQRDLRSFIIDPFKHIDKPKAGHKPPHVVRTFSDEEIHKLDQEICDIDSQIHLLGNLRPINMMEEQTKFLIDPAKNPQFHYRPLRFDPNNLLSRLSRLSFPDSPMGALWKKKGNEMERKIALLEARGNAREFTERSIALYGQPDEPLVQEALALLKRMPKTFDAPQKTLSTREAVKRFQKIIDDYGLKGWTVKIKEELVSDAIAGKENVIFVRAGATFAQARLLGTIAHEVETHLFTAANGREQPYRLFQRGLADYITTEEGLAVYNQERTAARDTEKHFWPASSVIGVMTALRGSFLDVYHQILRLGFSEERAWKVALKVKRGLSDTGQPGAFTKDHVYFRGHRMIQAFVRNGGDLRDLYIGKTNLEDLPIIKKIKGLKKPVYLPKYLQDEHDA